MKNNIAIRIAGKVSQYIDASMNRATPINYYKKDIYIYIIIYIIKVWCQFKNFIFFLLRKVLIASETVQ